MPWLYSSYFHPGIDESDPRTLEITLVRVTSTAFRDKQMAAIWQPSSAMGRPARRRPAAILDRARAVALKKRQYPHCESVVKQTCHGDFKHASLTTADWISWASLPAVQAAMAGISIVRINSDPTLECMEYDPGAQEKSGGSRIRPCFEGSNSTPPRDAKHSCARLAKSRMPPRHSVTASRRIMRTSSSIERWCRAARTRRRAFTSSRRLRIYLLAIDRT